MNCRLKKTFLKLTQEAIDGLIVSSPSNISYLTEFTSRDSYLLVSRKGNIYFTDSRYLAEAKEGLKKEFALEKTNGSPFKLIADSCLRLGLKKIGFEARHLPFAEYRKIKESLKEPAKLIPLANVIEEIRQIKEPEELTKIKKAANITVEALKFIRDFISVGKKEIEVAGELERFIRYRGADNSAFSIIVASGPNSAFPHHLTSQRKIKDNEPVLIDLGVEYMGYKSDLTRVFFPSKISGLAGKIYGIVLKAGELAVKKIKPGAPIGQIDAASRGYIAREGFGAFFGHNLGHGVGLEVHEQPQVSPRENAALEAGMVFTVEPAIYLPGKFGIRIEDMVLVTQDNCEVLSGSFYK